MIYLYKFKYDKMKQIIVGACALIASIGMTSCGGDSDPASIKTEDLKTACDCVDAMESIADRQLELLEGEETDEAEKEYEGLEEKLNEVNKHCRSEFKKEEAEKCDNFEAVVEKMKKVR